MQFQLWQGSQASKKKEADMRKHNPLAPACDDEAEALKNAPPWLGSWGHKPTVRQRIMLWVDYILRGDEQ